MATMNKEWIDEWTNEFIDEWAKEWITRVMLVSAINKLTNMGMNVTNQWMNEQMNEWLIELMNDWTIELTKNKGINEKSEEKKRL